MVSTLYQYSIEASYKMLPLDRIWRREVPGLEHDFVWGMVWANINLASQNPESASVGRVTFKMYSTMDY